MPFGVWLQGAVLGLLGSLMAVGLGLTYRLNKVINFAQGDLGTAPAVLAVGLIGFSGVNYFLGLATGLVASLLLTATVEILVVRRFRRSPRLILTVATIGLSQLLVVLSLLIPRIWGQAPIATAVATLPLAPRLARRACGPRRQRPGGGHRLGDLLGRRVTLVHSQRRRSGRAGRRRPPRPGVHARHPRRAPAVGDLGRGWRALLRQHFLPGDDPRPPARSHLRADRAGDGAGRAGPGQLHRAAGHRSFRRGAGHPRTGGGVGRPGQPRARAGRPGGRGVRRHRGAPAPGQPHRP